MSDLNKIELALRRAAAQMPNHQSRAFRLFADEIAKVSDETQTNTELNTVLSKWRIYQREIDS